MKTMIENALKASIEAKEQIAKIREKFNYPQEEYTMADDAALGTGWAIKRLKDLEAALSAQK
jgi:hypothetical protein